MDTLWVFGDSFSDFYKVPSKSSTDFRYRYLMWKNKPVKVYGEIISENLNLNLINKSSGGVSNSHIFEEFCKVSNKIGENDIVIFGWTEQSRFRLANRHDTWSNLAPSDLGKKVIDISGVSKNTISEIMVNRSNIPYSIELRNWIKLINIFLNGRMVFHWTWSDEIVGSIWKVGRYETIGKETNGEVVDSHWSEKGQMEFGNLLISKIKEGNLTTIKPLNIF